MHLDADSYWRLIAAADPLSPDMLARVWGSGSRSARTVIAARGDISEALSGEILDSGNPALLRAWASYPHRAESYVDRAVAACGSDELTASHLARQTHLSPAAALALISQGGGAVASVILQRDPALPRDVLHAAALRFAQSRVFTGWHAVSYLVGVVGSDPELWDILMSSCPEGSTAVPLAALEACDGSVEICRAALKWWSESHRVFGEDSRQDAIRTVDSLLSCYQLSPDDFRSIAQVALDRRQAERALELALLDPRGAVSQMLSGETTALVLDRITTAALQRVSLPFTQIMLAGLQAANREELTPQLAQLRTGLLGKGSRAVLASLWQTGQCSLAVEFVESTGSLLWDADELGPCPERLVTQLAAAGSQALLRSPICGEKPALVAGNYAPLPDALDVPAVAACVLAEIERAADGDSAVLETAMVLLGQWQGNLRELMRAASALATSSPGAAAITPAI